MYWYEVAFDGLPGPTHNYGGLAFGNHASMASKGQPSNPRKALQQSLDKMLMLVELGFKQAILPPHQRPHIPTLRQLGYQGTDRELLHTVGEEAPDLLRLSSSSSSMWAANSASFTPSIDTADGRAHLTPANLAHHFHRSIETDLNQEILKRVFPSEEHFKIHTPLPSHPIYGDEGSANQIRLTCELGSPGVTLLTYGRTMLHRERPLPSRFPARQTEEASAAISRLHSIPQTRFVTAQQSPISIEAGAIHLDVVAMGNQNVLIYHEHAFLNKEAVIEELANKISAVCGSELLAIEVGEEELPLEVAIRSYLFNSQLVTQQDGAMVVIAPVECRADPVARRFLESLPENGATPICTVIYSDVSESMRNGGGPGCLRLRTLLSDKELRNTNYHVFLDHTLHTRLTEWANRYYRDHLELDDLRDPNLLLEVRTGLDELTHILELGSIYSFQ